MLDRRKVVACAREHGVDAAAAKFHVAPALVEVWCGIYPPAPPSGAGPATSGASNGPPAVPGIQGEAPAESGESAPHGAQAAGGPLPRSGETPSADWWRRLAEWLQSATEFAAADREPSMMRDFEMARRAAEDFAVATEIEVAAR